jgi:hypothetical protein
VGREERRHPELADPVAEAQEEATWSAYTRYFRAGSQGKRLFRSRGRGEPRGLPLTTVVVSVLGGIAIGVVAGFLVLIGGFSIRCRNAPAAERPVSESVDGHPGA